MRRQIAQGRPVTACGSAPRRRPRWYYARRYIGEPTVNERDRQGRVHHVLVVNIPGDWLPRGTVLV